MWNLEWSNAELLQEKTQQNTTLVSDFKRNIPKFDTVTQTGAASDETT